ncbi:alpha/beta hydrolase [Halomonas ramblicola]|uniref:alpha/beta hydrolase n=1 Tax=Halomonas ramblicola TaxID=747349 RepID=UPI0025B53909|nr:alpha/beta hydrolase [Halomonas ramblicola]MDN3520541.1 lysophospholipase [Halomonas ramblicola]
MTVTPRRHHLVALLTGLLLAGCGQTTLQQPGPGAERARLEPDRVIAEDGYRLPLRHWPTGETPRAVVLAVHGFNDHGGSFEIMAEALTPHGIAVYAHDQRGFGLTEQRRLWPGHRRLVADVELLAELLRERHPETPLYLVGKSMGAAVVLLALAGETPPPVDGSVLISPAVWGLDAMPWYQRLSLWLGIRLIPSVSFSANAARRLGIQPTDDPEIRRRLAQDPLILRRARVDTLYGVTETMSLALEAAEGLTGPALILYGDEDQVIPPEAMCALFERLPEAGADEPIWQFALYPDGYHMLTRYTRRDRTEADLAAWLLDPGTALPSGHERDRDSATRRLCATSSPRS